MIALVARVVPWIAKATSPAAMPALPSTFRTPSRTPRSGALGVVSTFAVQRRRVFAVFRPLQREVGEGAADVDGEPRSSRRRHSMLRTRPPSTRIMLPVT